MNLQPETDPANNQKIIIHAGFHKTATTTLQEFFRINRSQLCQEIEILNKGDFGTVEHAATNFSKSKSKIDLAKFSIRFHRLVKTVSKQSNKNIFISNEELSGLMPGWLGVKDYSAAPILASSISNICHSILGKNSAITFLYTTRETNSWLQSAYAHQIQNPKAENLSFEEFKERYADAVDFPNLITQIQKKSSGCQVKYIEYNSAAENGSDAINWILDELHVSEKTKNKLDPVAPKNVQRSDPNLDKLISLSRAAMDDIAYEEQKSVLITKIRNR